MLFKNKVPLYPLRLDIDPIVSSPSVIDMDLVKMHCAIDSTDFDTVLSVYLGAAIAWAENTTHRTIFERGHRWVLQSFPFGNPLEEIRLPRGKTTAVEKIVLDLSSGILNLFGPSGSPPGTDFQEDLSGDDGGVLMPSRGGIWPEIEYDTPSPVTIHFTAGYASGQVPDDIIHAILFAVSDALELRGSADLNTRGPAFDAREALISAYRLQRFY